MTLKEIPIDELLVKPLHLWQKQWVILSCGDFKSGKFNAMTVGWGSLGTMWNDPFAQVVVRPQRYTREFIDRYDTFTLSVFHRKYQKKVLLMGQISGRDTDKIKEAGFTPIESTKVAAPGFAEADLIMECQKIYWQDMDPALFLDPEIDKKNYPEKDYHRIYYGKIVAVYGEDSYRI